MNHDLDELAGFAAELADSVGERHREVFHAPPPPEIKDDGTPVTALDVETEDRLRERIVERFPDHGILGEERETRNPGAEWTWIIDPIDGTKSFVAGVPMYTILIGLAHRDDGLVLGAVDQPILRSRWIGGPGHATVTPAGPARTRQGVTLRDAFITVGSLDHFGDLSDGFDRVVAGSRWTMVGRDSYLAGLLAGGRLDAVVLDRLNVYDYAALVPVVEGAGGVAVDLDGRRASLDPPDVMVFAGSAELAREIVDTVRA